MKDGKDAIIRDFSARPCRTAPKSYTPSLSAADGQALIAADQADFLRLCSRISAFYPGLRFNGFSSNFRVNPGDFPHVQEEQGG
jgi:hypothetical protein